MSSLDDWDRIQDALSESGIDWGFGGMGRKSAASYRAYIHIPSGSIAKPTISPKIKREPIINFTLLNGCWKNDRVTIEIDIINKTYARIINGERLVKNLVIINFNQTSAEIKSEETIIDVIIKDYDTITLAKKNHKSLLFTRDKSTNSNVYGHEFTNGICCKCGNSLVAVEYFKWHCKAN